ncbi:PspA/IM30 family protein [Streptomyces sp. NPDC007907]|uniref:PspA/IM30 family protein n=1 Tax=Streptomyces sp. NPDC007907 TaxID=3364789 RepID=UPI0036DFE441
MATPPEHNGGLPARWGEALGWARQVIELFQALDSVGASGLRPAQHMIGQLDTLSQDGERRIVQVLTDRNALRRYRADTAAEERDLTAQAAAAMKGIGETQDPPPKARTALKRAHRLRADLASSEADLVMAEETVRRYQQCQTLLREYRANLQRKLNTLEWHYRAAEAHRQQADLADRLRDFDALGADLTARVRDFAAEAEARSTTAFDREDMQIADLRYSNQETRIDEELNGYRGLTEY